MKRRKRSLLSPQSLDSDLTMLLFRRRTLPSAGHDAASLSPPSTSSKSRPRTRQNRTPESLSRSSSDFRRTSLRGGSRESSYRGSLPSPKPTPFYSPVRAGATSRLVFSRAASRGSVSFEQSSESEKPGSTIHPTHHKSKQELTETRHRSRVQQQHVAAIYPERRVVHPKKSLQKEQSFLEELAKAKSEQVEAVALMKIQRQRRKRKRRKRKGKEERRKKVATTTSNTEQQHEQQQEQRQGQQRSAEVDAVRHLVRALLVCFAQSEREHPNSQVYCEAHR